MALLVLVVVAGLAVLFLIPGSTRREWTFAGSKSGAFGVVLRNLVFSREYTMLDRINFFRGVRQSVKALYPELSRIDLFVQVPEVKIPVYFCLGRHDYEVPSVLSATYFEALKAPQKQTCLV